MSKWETGTAPVRRESPPQQNNEQNEYVTLIHVSDYITAAILGIIEGITEMLPVSSTGHLIIVNQWFSFSKEFTELFDVCIQGGAILAVLWYFRTTIFPFAKGERLVFPRLWTLAITAIIPILILGYFFGHDIQETLFNPTVVAVALIFNGILLIMAERLTVNRTPRVQNLDGMTMRDAIKIGIFQVFALIPGMSRSASTMIGGLFIGIERNIISQFSFIIAIPVLLIASIYTLISYTGTILASQYTLLAVGFFFSYVFCYFTVKWFFLFIKKSGLSVFGYYRIALGVIILIALY